MPITFQGAPYPADSNRFTALNRRLINNAAAGASGTGATSRRTIINGMFDGDISTSAVAGAFYRISLNTGSLTHNFDSVGPVDLRGTWSLMFRTFMVGNAGNSHILFSIGADAANGVPTTGISIGIEIPDATTARLWQCNNTTPVYSSLGTLPTSIASIAVTGDHIFWLDCNGSTNTISLFCAFKTFASTFPAKPTTPICSLSNIPAALPSDRGVSVLARATATSPTVFTGLGLRDCVFTEY